MSFADALSGVPAAALFDAPMLLVAPDTIPDAVAAELQRLLGAAACSSGSVSLQRQVGELNIVLLGGSAAIGGGVESLLWQYTGLFDPSTGTFTPLGQPGSIDFIVTDAILDPGRGTDADPTPTPTRHRHPVAVEVDVPPPATGTVAGTVTDADGGAAIAGATVTLQPGGRSATTTADGSYTITSVPAGSYTARASAVGYASLDKAAVVTANTTTTVDFALTEIPEPPGDELTVQLNWQNVHREGAWGAVDEYAAFHLDEHADDEENDTYAGAGEVTLEWDADTGSSGTRARPPSPHLPLGFTLHEGGLAEEGDVVANLIDPVFTGPTDEPRTGTAAPSPTTLEGAIQDADLVEHPRGAPPRPSPGGTCASPRSTTLRRGARPAGTADRSGLDDIVPLYRHLEFHELGTGTNTGDAQTSFNLLFDAWVDYPEATQDWPKPDDFVLTLIPGNGVPRRAAGPAGAGQQRGMAALPQAGHANPPRHPRA
jgi:hypothetical protein